MYEYLCYFVFLFRITDLLRWTLESALYSHSARLQLLRYKNQIMKYSRGNRNCTQTQSTKNRFSVSALCISTMCSVELLARLVASTINYVWSSNNSSSNSGNSIRPARSTAFTTPRKKEPKHTIKSNFLRFMFVTYPIVFLVFRVHVDGLWRRQQTCASKPLPPNAKMLFVSEFKRHRRTTFVNSYFRNWFSWAHRITATA